MIEEKKKIFISEDDEDIIFVLKAGLEEYEIISAGDGVETLRKIKKEKPELIVLDIMMPKLNGADVNLKLKQDKELKDIPVVIITGRPNMQDLFADSGKNEVSGFLEKPFAIDILKKEIERILGK